MTKRMKKILIICSVVLAGILGVMFWLVNSFTMFEVQEEILASHPISGKDFKIEIKRVAAGATTSDVIQVRKVHPNGKFEVIKSIDGYSNLVTSNVVNDSLLRFVVKDTGYANNQPDTVEVQIE